ncbi:murein hydrolase effector protein LrgB [Terasakiispira papahanaumokuakeensis]|uniref:Murein hydrolase effector protein LrgB n=1 Tax=Terasakiispira papahanaumokuakeensis TaxID=197479 RepID=A0A1E2V8J4_9GAMM|nr:LrgB family protein [Terasakiispira papahanaumokuakeensis]ODC03182.1 murein hydrolase effector protein LrgB [Terasakiispira papahanaumokuakeensis]
MNLFAIDLPDMYLAFLSLLATIGFYYLAKWLHQRKRVVWRAPILVAPLAIIALVMMTDIPLDDYYLYTHFLVLMLGPATIAFAVPIYQQRDVIRRYPITLIMGVLTGLLLGLVSSWALVHLFPLPDELARSMLVRSVSTPFAIEAVASFGGVPDLTAMLVVITGIIGMIVCEPVFKVARIRSPLAKGAALGAASHGAGTAKATELGREEGVIASLTMIFTGISMVVGAPLFAHVLS